MSDDHGRMKEVAAPVIGFEIGAGQVHGVNEDGVMSAPIVELGLQTADDDEIHHYTLIASMTAPLSRGLKEAGELSLAHYLTPRLQEERGRQRKRERRWTIAQLAFVLTIMVALSVLDGVIQAQPYHHHGGVAVGVADGIGYAWQLIGMGMTMVFLLRFVRRLRRQHSQSARWRSRLVAPFRALRGHFSSWQLRDRRTRS